MVVLFAVSGCKEKPITEAPPESVDLFRKGKGVWLPEKIRSDFGLVVEEVSERQFLKSVRKPAQVFRMGGKGEPGEAVVSLSTSEARDLRMGDRVALNVAEGPALSGTLKQMDKQMESLSGRVEGIIEFTAGEGLKAGSFVEVEFGVRNGTTGLAVPEQAILKTAGGDFVYARNGEHLIRTLVRTGAKEDGFVEVEEGLYAGDAVVTKGIENVWLVELSALKGGKPCCAVPKKAGKT
jgi:multidrug efflux pump subunit AcrA (membrane-fusion protein)